MSLLIDGYNLLHVSGILGPERGPGGLQASRLAMLNFLAASIDPEELPRTIVVFDAGDPPWGMPQQMEHRGIDVRFAAKYESADELIEELIQAESAPRRLVVVSSDHRIQRAARRRKAKAIDSDIWYADLTRARRQRQESAADVPARPAVPLLEEDVNYWLRQFGGESALREFLAAERGDTKPEGRKPTSNDKPAKNNTASGGESDILDNPFPPGYAEDLRDGI
jgi:predicted RNA-binding protein with PIN domain